MQWFGVFLLFSVLHAGWCCRDGWQTHGGKCYFFSRDQETWADASVMCQHLKGQLVEIEDKDENNYLKAQARLHGSNFWIALWDIEEEGTWRWYNSDVKLTAESFTDWFPGQPDNYNSHEDCGLLYSNVDYQWNDAPCNNQLNYICEQDSTSGQVIG